MAGQGEQDIADKSTPQDLVIAIEAINIVTVWLATLVTLVQVAVNMADAAFQLDFVVEDVYHNEALEIGLAIFQGTLAGCLGQQGREGQDIGDWIRDQGLVVAVEHCRAATAAEQQRGDFPGVRRISYVKKRYFQALLESPVTFDSSIIADTKQAVLLPQMKVSTVTRDFQFAGHIWVSRILKVDDE